MACRYACITCIYYVISYLVMISMCIHACIYGVMWDTIIDYSSLTVMNKCSDGTDVLAEGNVTDSWAIAFQMPSHAVSKTRIIQISISHQIELSS